MNQLDYTFAVEGTGALGVWGALDVVRFRGAEEISGLYRYEITLAARSVALDVDPHDLIEAHATLRIATLSIPEYKVVHGVITSAEELGVTHGRTTYRVVLEPPLCRARLRKRYRIFLEKTLREIITTVLEGDPLLTLDASATVTADVGCVGPFTAPKERFSFRVADTSRLDDRAARPYCVQYGESDLAFVSRLLEEEGIAYHFENGEDLCLLVMADRDAGRSRLSPFVPLGPTVDARHVSSVRLGARLRPGAVTVHDYNWKNPALKMVAKESSVNGRAKYRDLAELEYPGGFHVAPAHGQPLAQARLERYEVEASFSVLETRARVLSAGSIFALEHDRPRYEGEYLVTRIELSGEQQGVLSAHSSDAGVVFDAEVECARRGHHGPPEESLYRPARVTPKPRIHGSQTAFVTAAPGSDGAEIHVGGPNGGEIGCVRLRFHWDQDHQRLAKEGSSCWVRVSQVFAGVGEGGVWHPRVGVEAIVEFEDGDPDRPLVTGRVYNGANRPPAGSPTYSALKSYSSPANGKYNELSFEDAAGNERILLHASRDWNNEIGRDRAEMIGANSSSHVGAERSEVTGASRSSTVAASNTEVVGADEMRTIGANHMSQVGANYSLSIGANHTSMVGGKQVLDVTGDALWSVKGAHKLTVDGEGLFHVKGPQIISTTGVQIITAHGPQLLSTENAQTVASKGVQKIHSDTSQEMTAPTQTFTADTHQNMNSTGLFISTNAYSMTAQATAVVESPMTSVHGQSILVIDGGAVSFDGKTITITSKGKLDIKGGNVSITGSNVSVDGGSVLDMKAGTIKLNS